MSSIKRKGSPANLTSNPVQHAKISPANMVDCSAENSFSKESEEYVDCHVSMFQSHAFHLYSVFSDLHESSAFQMKPVMFANGGGNGQHHPQKHGQQKRSSRYFI